MNIRPSNLHEQICKEEKLKILKLVRILVKGNDKTSITVMNLLISVNQMCNINLRLFNNSENVLFLLLQTSKPEIPPQFSIFINDIYFSREHP